MNKKGIYKVAIVGIALFLVLLMFAFLPFLSSQNANQPISITVLNPQSYPIVGGYWSVRFNTTGKANLTIKTVNGTHFGKDIELQAVKCGNVSIPFTWINSDTAFVPDYSCDLTSIETSKVSTTGVHNLEFDFQKGANLVRAYAHNFASTGNWVVQSGETTMTGTSTTVNIATPVNTSRAFILLSRRASTSYDDPDKSGIYSQWVNGTRFTLNQYSATAGAVIDWQVIESGSINVQNGTQAYGTGDTSFDIPINSVNTSRTVVFMNFGSCSVATLSVENEIFWTGNVTNSTNLHLQRDSSGSCAGTVSYYVVEFNDGSTIQQGEIPNVGTLAYANVNPVNLSDTWFYFSSSFDSTANSLRDTGVVADPYNTTAFQVARDTSAAGNARVQWYAISTPGAVVQAGDTDLSTSNNIDVPISSVVLNRSFVINSFNDSGGGTTYANTMGTALITTSTNLNLQRGTTGQSNVQGWQVVQMPLYIPTWYDSNLLRCANVTIVNAGASALTNFPSYINITNLANMNPDLSDVKFVNAPCNITGTALPFEIESVSSNHADAWVLTNLSTGNTTISLYYDNATSVTSTQNASAVWSNNYRGVWHLANVGGSLSTVDSTSNQNNGTNSGASLVSGLIDGAGSFNGASNYVSLPNNLLTTDNFTISTWFKTTSNGVLFSENNQQLPTASTQYDPILYVGTTGLLQGGIYAGGYPTTLVSTTAVNDGNWHLGTYTVTGNNQSLWLDGKYIASYSSATPEGTTTYFYMGTGYSGGGWPNLGTAQWYYFPGTIDQMELSNGVVSPEWLNQSYQMQSAQSSFVFLGNSLTTSNQPPTAPTSITCGGSTNCNVSVDPTIVLNASGSVDPEGDVITYVIEASLQNSSTSVVSQSSSVVSLGTITTTPYTSSGTNSFSVPSGVTSLTVKAWGAGGAGGAGGSDVTNGFGGNGAGGGFAISTISVTPGESLNTLVGGGGQPGVVAGTTTAAGDGGGGGGMTEVSRGTTPLIVAAGGAGGGGGDNSAGAGSQPGGAGGVGGGTTGGNGVASGTAGAGLGGTQSAGGAAGTGGATSGTAGSSLTGGQGGDNNAGTTGGGGAGGTGGGGAGGAASSAAFGGGGGGGAGYFGGGGGSASTSGEGAAGGGGGGSSYLTGTSTYTASGSGQNPGNNTDSDYLTYSSNAGTGGNGGIQCTDGTCVGTAGTAGLLTITYMSPLSTDTNSTPVTYSNFNQDYYYFDNLSVTVQVDSYDPSSSVSQSSSKPDLWLEMYDGSSWVSVGKFDLPSSYTGSTLNTTAANFTLVTTDNAILDGWKNMSNQQLRIKGIYMDNDGSTPDRINFTNIWLVANGKKWAVIGNHTSSGTFLWNVTNLPKQSGVDLRARAIDLGGSDSYSEYYDKGAYMAIKDNNPPNVSIIYPSDGSTIADITPTFTVNSNALVNSLLYSINGSSNKTLCTGCIGTQDYNYLYLPEGTTQINLYGIDGLGRVGSASSLFNVNMNFNYYDNFTDNSSIIPSSLQNVSWTSSGVNFETHPLVDHTFYDGFESGSIVSNWTTYVATGGQILVDSTPAYVYDGTYSIIMDSVSNNNYALEELVTNYDFSGAKNIILNFFERDWTDEVNTCPLTWTGHNDCDGVAYTCDGNTWYRIYDLSAVLGQSTWTQRGPINISADANFCSQINSSFAIKFQHYDNFPLTSDGIGFDDINVTWRTDKTETGSFMSYPINTTSPVTSISNITWTTANESSNNNISIEISADNGANWYNVTNGQDLPDLAPGSSLLYRALYSSTTPTTLSLKDINFTWSNTIIPPPNVTINYPLNSTTINDVTPLLNVSVDELANALWYTTNNGASNTTICTDCNGTNDTFLHLPEGTSTIKVYANDTAGRLGSANVTFDIDMNYSYYDNFTDNSSIDPLNFNNLIWQPNNISFISNPVIHNDFYDGFETGTLTSNWTSYLSSANAQILITGVDGTHSGSYAAIMDSNTNNAYALEEMTTAYDFSGANNIILNFFERDWTDEVNTCPLTWTGHNDCDGVAYTCDGNTWYRIYDLSAVLGQSTWTQRGPINISANANFCSQINSSFAIKFQHYDNFPLTSDGIGFDDINITWDKSNALKANFTAQSIHTIATVRGITNVTWNTSNTNANNNITLQISADNGANWYNVTNGNNLTLTSGAGHDLIYRALFNAIDPGIISLLDVAINWTDFGLPSVSISYPLNQTYTSNINHLNYLITGSNLDSCWYSTNGGLINTSTSCLGTSITGLSSVDGQNTWTVYANSTSGFETSNAVSFYVDTQAPTINLTAPANATQFPSGTVQFNWTADDNLDPSPLCNLTVGGTQRASIYSNAGVPTTYNVTGLSDGSYSWYVVCSDQAGNTNTSETREFSVKIQTTLRQVVTGSGVTSGTLTYVTFPTPLANISKAFSFVTYNHTFSNDHANTYKAFKIINTTTAAIYGGGTNAVYYRYAIFEFDQYSPLVVYRPNLTFNANPSPPLYFDIGGTLNSLSDSFSVWQGHEHDGSDSTIGDEEFATYRIFNETSMEYNVGTAPNSGPQIDHAEVVEWNDPNFVDLVQSDDTSQLGTTETSLVITPATPVDPNRTLLFLTYREGSGQAYSEPPSVIGLHATLDDNGNIVINRSATGPQLFLSWQLVEFKPGYAQVQHITGTVANGVGTGNFPLPYNSVNTARSAAFGTVNEPFGLSGAMSTSTSGGAIDDMMFSMYLINSSFVRAVRGTTTGTDTIGIQVLYFTGAPTISGVNATSITNTGATIVWSTNVPSNSTVSYWSGVGPNSTTSNSYLVTSHSVPLTGLTPNTTYFYNVTSCSTNGCSNQTGFNFTTTVTPATAPEVILLNPSDNYAQNYSLANFSYNTTDVNNNIANSTLVLNNVLNQTNQTLIVPGEVNNLSVNLPDGIYNWTVNVTDTTNLVGTATPRKITIDTHAPNTTSLYPANNTVVYDSNVEFNFTVTDNLASSMTCNLIVDGLVAATNASTLNNTNTNLSAGLSVGDHWWNVTCVDAAGNVGTSSARNITVFDIPPTVSLITFNESYFNSSNIILKYTPSDNNGVVLARLILDGASNISNQSEIGNGTINDFVVNGVTEGQHTWNVNVTDTSGLNATNTTRTFYVDLHAPQINLNLPTNNSNYNYSKINFNFTVTDNMDPMPMLCNLTAGDVNATNLLVTNGTLFNTELNMTDGLKQWNVTCVDAAGNTNTSESRWINISEPPKVNLTTANNSNFNTSTVTLSYIPSDNTALASCSLYLDGAFNQSTVEMIGGVVNNFTVSGTPQGYHNWSVSCNDTSGFVNQSETRYFLVNLGNIEITLLAPPDGDNIFSDTVNFSYNATENIDPTLLCNITVDGTVVDNSTVTAGAITNRTIKFLTGGTKFWNVTCIDSANNINTSATRNFTLAFPPIVSLVSPINGTAVNSSNVVLYYDAADPNNNIASSQLIINGAANITNQTPIQNEATNNFTISLGDGVYNWTVNVTDTTNLVGTANQSNFTVDTHAPTIVLNSPADGITYTWNNISLNFTATDNLAQNPVCDVYINGSITNPQVVSTNGTDTIAYYIEPDGYYYWQVLCNDSANNTGSSPINYFTMKAPPNVTLVSPPDNNLTNQSDISFQYIADDPISIPQCSLVLDGTVNKTANSITPGITNAFTVYGVSQGPHNWTVNCTDSDGNTFAPANRTLTIDQTPPFIYLDSPLNDSGVYYTGTVDFKWTPVDTYDPGIFSCDLYVDGTIPSGGSNLLASNGTQAHKSVSVSQGYHNWSVSCRDSSYNYNMSQTNFFNFTYPDFVINATSIVFNETSPKENDTVAVNVTTYNLGGADIPNLLVRLYNGDPASGGSLIGSSTLSINRFGSNLTSIPITIPLGTTSIYASADPLNSYTEWNESNNNWSKSLTVSSWQYLYGDINAQSNFTLANSNNSGLYDWGANLFQGGNLFVVDSQSPIPIWTSLKAIGRDTSGVNTTNDFSDIDTLLGMTSFNDSVSNLYATPGQQPKNVSNFVLYNLPVENVPVAESINNSNFTTGILWDSSQDSGDGQFDTTDKEDLVFVSKIHNQVQGTYGTYDYEVRVPAKLRDYSGTTAPVAIYVELT